MSTVAISCHLSLIHPPTLTHHNIFNSLGLILLELFCSFGSLHERAATFHDCRRGTLPKILTGKNEVLNDIGKLILECTDSDLCKRPTASKLVKSNIFSETKIAKLREMDMEKLESELACCTSVVERQRLELMEKEEVIKRLREELKAVQDDTIYRNLQ